jgi:hypothetical protein
MDPQPRTVSLPVNPTKRSALLADVDALSLNDALETAPATPGFSSHDLKVAYLHIPVAPQFRKLQVEWRPIPNPSFWPQYCAMDPYQMLGPPVMHLRSLGLHIHHYLVDWLIPSSFPQEVFHSLDTTLLLLASLGLVIHSDKSDLVPRTRFDFLGMDLDFAVCLVRPSADNLARATPLACAFHRADRVKVRLLLSLIGRLSYLALSFL